jgi:hypothetical protein
MLARSLSRALQVALAHSLLPSPKGTRDSLSRALPMIPCIARYRCCWPSNIGHLVVWKSAIGGRDILFLTLDIDDAECRFLGKFENIACLAGQEANAAIVFALDQVLTTVIADELDAVAMASVGILVFALESKSLNNHVEVDFWLVPVTLLLAFRVRAAGLGC